jgi:hypothetical protein
MEHPRGFLDGVCCGQKVLCSTEPLSAVGSLDNNDDRFPVVGACGSVGHEAGICTGVGSVVGYFPQSCVVFTKEKQNKCNETALCTSSAKK